MRERGGHETEREASTSSSALTRLRESRRVSGLQRRLPTHPRAPPPPATHIPTPATPQRLGKNLSSLETKQASLNDRLMALTSSGASLADIQAASLALAEAQADYEASEERWLVLAEIAGDI